MNVRSTLLSTVAVFGVLITANAAMAQNTPATGAAQVIQVDGRSALSPGLTDAGQFASGMVLEHAVGMALEIGQRRQHEAVLHGGAAREVEGRGEGCHAPTMARHGAPSILPPGQGPKDSLVGNGSPRQS